MLLLLLIVAKGIGLLLPVLVFCRFETARKREERARTEDSSSSSREHCEQVSEGGRGDHESRSGGSGRPRTEAARC